MRRISNRPSEAHKVGKGLGQYTGAETQSDQNAEANRILEMLRPLRWACRLTERESQFLEGLWDNPNRPITGKMLFWLRDIHERYCL